MASMNETVTVELLTPWLLADGLAVFALAVVVLSARRWIGWPSALLVAGGLLPHALKYIIIGSLDLLRWFGGSSSPPELWLPDDLVFLIYAAETPGLVVSALAALRLSFQLRGGRRSHLRSRDESGSVVESPP